MTGLKKATARRVLLYRVHVVGSHLPDSTYTSRGSAEEQAASLRRSGLRVVVHPVHSPLPTNPWLCIEP